MESEGTNIFDLFNFNFMLVSIKTVGEKIRNNPMSDPLGEDWNQLPPLPQGPLGIPPPPSQDMAFLDKGSVTLFPPLIQKKEQGMEDAEYQ